MTRVATFDRVTRAAMRLVGKVLMVVGLVPMLIGAAPVLAGDWLLRRAKA